MNMKHRDIHSQQTWANGFMSVAAFSVITAMSVFSNNLQAEIYKWKDEQGQVHYSATPPPSKTIDLENISDDISLRSGKPSQLNTNTDKLADKPHSDSNANTSNNHTKQSNYCNHQKQALQTLKENEFVKWKSDDQDIILEGDMKAQKINELSQEIDQYCNQQANSSDQVPAN